MEAKIYEKMVKKFKLALMSFFLCLLVYWLFPYFFLSQILITLDPLKKSILRQTPKKYFCFLISIYFVLQLQLFSSITTDKCWEHIPLQEKLLNSWFTIYLLLLHLTVCNMYWDCITCFAFHSCPSIKIIASWMFSGGHKYSATTE